MNQELIKKVMNIFEKASIKKLKVETDDIKISLTKSDSTVAPQVAEVPSSIIPVQNNEVLEKKVEDTYLTIKADSVGFFNPKITQKDIKAKKKISKGSTIYSITSMNIDHDKNLENDCTVIEFLVTKGTPVEYGQPVARVNES